MTNSRILAGFVIQQVGSSNPAAGSFLNRRSSSKRRTSAWKVLGLFFGSKASKSSGPGPRLFDGSSFLSPNRKSARPANLVPARIQRVPDDAIDPNSGPVSELAGIYLV